MSMTMIMMMKMMRKTMINMMLVQCKDFHAFTDFNVQIPLAQTNCWNDAHDEEKRSW